ncbi:hypothetical protein [uncultured Cohaesibacter sp.]|uniref:hypothetical protein n=1 Tax=uncultured Cohaesibacter sp. TaxID=1002546 RepID=UPI002AA6EB6E|nr:hypothetical protein [uncultured Cohaesibacter sp.]
MSEKLKYAPDQMYSVRVAKVVRFKGTPLRPRHTYQLRGRVLNELEGVAIKSADLIEEPKDAV